MRCITTEFNLTVLKSYTLKRKKFAWRNFESLKYKNFTPFNSRGFLSATLRLFEHKWNYTLFLKTSSETMQNFSWSMEDRILTVNMLYFICAIVKIWQSKVATNFYLSLIFIPENLIPQAIKSKIGIETYYKKRNLNFTQAQNLKPLNFFTTLTS